MPFGYNMNKVHATKKEDFIEKNQTMIYQKQISQQNLTLVIGFGLNHIQKIRPPKYNSDKSDMSDMSFYHKPWHQLTPAQRSAVSDMDSIMDY